MPVIICPIKLFELNQNIYINTEGNHLALIGNCLMENLPEALVSKCEEYECETIKEFEEQIGKEDYITAKGLSA